jgi:pilus assembly protein Flp/PilA
MAKQVRPLHNPNIEYAIPADAIQKERRIQGPQGSSQNAPTEGFEMNNLFLNVYIKFQILMDREDGQDMVEYALIVASLAFAAVAGMKGLAGGLNTAYINLSAKLGSTIM